MVLMVFWNGDVVLFKLASQAQLPESQILFGYILLAELITMVQSNKEHKKKTYMVVTG